MNEKFSVWSFLEILVITIPNDFKTRELVFFLALPLTRYHVSMRKSLPSPVLGTADNLGSKMGKARIQTLASELPN